MKIPNDDNNYISTTSDKNSLRVFIVVYAEFECLLVKIDSCQKNLAFFKSCINRSYIENKDIYIYLADTL